MSAISSRREYTTQTPQHPKAHQKTNPQNHHTTPKPTQTRTTETHTTNSTPHPPTNPTHKTHSPSTPPYPHPRHAPHRPTPSTASRPTQTPSASNETPPPTPNAATPSTTTAPLAPCLAAATLGRSPRADAPDWRRLSGAGRPRASLGVCAHSRPCEASPACPTLRYRPARRPRPAAAVARHALPRGATRAHAAGWQSSPLFRHGARWDWHSGRWGRRAASLPSRSVGLCAVRERTGCWQDGMSRGCWGWKCLCAGRWCHRGRRSVGSVGDSGWG
jgi:hypothetical protein